MARMTRQDSRQRTIDMKAARRLKYGTMNFSDLEKKLHEDFNLRKAV